MRKYLTNQELEQAVEQLVTEKDPGMLKVFAQLYIYHLQPGAKTSAGANRMLRTPKSVGLHFADCLLAIAALTLLICHPFLAGLANIVLLVIIGVFFVAEAAALFCALARFKDARRYIVVNELIERGIIQITGNPAGR